MKKRLDILITERRLSETREKAKALIMSGVVYVNNEKQDKAGAEFEDTVDIQISDSLKYVSRGGYKLEKAIDKYNLDLSGCICADIGASTGGFSDCMLQNNATKVYAVDVGYGQLAWSLRNDERVVCLERTNARYLNEMIIPEKLDFFSMDVSFISVRLILPSIYPLLNEHAKGVILIKPQFEAGKGKVGKNGVVREPATHKEVLKDITDYLINSNYAVLGLDYSPIKGPKGNIEYLAFVEKSGDSNPFDIDKLVNDSHVELNHE